MIRKELHEVHLLRGAASLMVCLFHLILGNQDLFPSDNTLEKTFSFGYLGVEIFFILSGYVICYSFPNTFSFRHLKTFFFKRIVRIEPPYIVSIILIIVLNTLSHKMTGLPNDLDFVSIISHVAYINNFFPATYVNVVYWTLGIEFQFYFLIAFLFPLMKASKNVLLLVAVFFIGISCLPISYAVSVIVAFLSYFALGILLFFYKIQKEISLLLFVIFSMISCLQILIFQGSAGFIAAVITVLALLFWNYTNKAIRFFSTISYSLYLIHVPIGGKVVNFGMRYAASAFSRYVLVLLAIAASISFAFIFYKFVELPALKFSKRFSYKFSDGPTTSEKEASRTAVENEILIQPT